MFAVVCVLATPAKSAALATVENVDANVDDLDVEASRRRRVRNFRPQRRRGGYFPRWLFGG